jgi:hypothetical protein
MIAVLWKSTRKAHPPHFSKFSCSTYEPNEKTHLNPTSNLLTNRTAGTKTPNPNYTL